MKNIVYDFGANNGDDIPYYLLKADLVVALEANTDLCRMIENRFSKEIHTGRLAVENKVLSIGSRGEDKTFYIHKSNHVLSQFQKPDDFILAEFEEIEIQSIDPIEIIKKYGEPYYLKIDLEGYDLTVLNHLTGNGIFPAYISAELHSMEIFDALAATGKYDSFKLVDGRSVAKFYQNYTIKDQKGDPVKISFPFHAAGPFGEDIRGRWLSKTGITKQINKTGCGWKDIHATTLQCENFTNPSLGEGLAKLFLKIRHKVTTFRTN